MSTIPASAIVNVNPGVIGSGGSALNLQALVLTGSQRVPVGQVLSFPTNASVISFFGDQTTESIIAADYFAGFLNSNVKPGSILFAQYNSAAVPAWLRGGSMSGLSLSQLQALNGVLTITVNGTAVTSGTINLSAATSFSNAATIIQTAFSTFAGIVSYDSTSGAFVFTTTLTGATASINFATGTLSAGLKLTSATGATKSQGAASATPAALMNSLRLITQNWATFMLAFDPDNGSGNTLKMQFATWTAQQNNAVGFACWDTDITPTASTNASASMGQLLKTANASGTYLIYAPDYNLAAFLCGALASIDFEEHNGRATMAFKSGSGMLPTVFDSTSAANLEANGYNYYGAFATANDQFTFFYPGSVSGQFKWADSFVNQIWLNNSFQLALMVLLTSIKAIPYNPAGYGQIRAAMMDTVNAGLNFGAFVPGVNLSESQIAQVNYAAGLKIDQTLSNQGYYLQILPASPQVRGNRGTPPITYWYMDGGSVQRISLASILVQ